MLRAVRYAVQMAPCPICGRPASARDESGTIPSSAPFCSPRCKLVDLGKWLNEDYRVPVQHELDLDDDRTLNHSPHEEDS
jgi:endogenous inhibitor of DNA gyrase (YacG/DUF329 family)